MCPDLLNPYRVFQQTVVKRKKKKIVLCGWLIYTGLYYKIMYVQGKKRRSYMFYESSLIQSYYRLQKHGWEDKILWDLWYELIIYVY